MKAILLLSTLLLTSSAFANSWIMCGKTANFDDGTVTDYELELSSENDKYTGTVGGSWNLKLEENGNWLDANKNIVAQSTEKDGDTSVEIKITQAKSVTGPVGIKYVLKNLFDEEPTLEKFTMGGFAGTVRIGTFKCIAGYD